MGGDFQGTTPPLLDNGSSSLQVSGKILLAAIIVLFLVILFVLFLHLYARWLWRRRQDAEPQSRPSRRRFVFAPNQDPVFSLHRGLDSSVIRSLPVLIFNSDDFKDGLECAVCLCEVSDGEKARLLPKCNHGFHVDCIDMWFQSHSTCPLCRNSVGGEESQVSSPEVLSPQGNSATGYLVESPNFPTNVLFWGNQSQVSTRGTGLEEGPSSSLATATATATSSSSSSSPDGALVIEIPRLFSDLSSLSSPSSRVVEEEMKSPGTTRLRSLRRLLSREKRMVHPCSPSPRGVDVEEGEGGRGQSSSKTTTSDL